VTQVHFNHGLTKENKKNLRYEPGIAGPFREDRGTGDEGKLTTAVSRAPVDGGKVEFKCPHCFVWGHQRKSSKSSAPGDIIVTCNRWVRLQSVVARGQCTRLLVELVHMQHFLRERLVQILFDRVVLR
jgi:cell division FtsZ-interacting protein ZapD